MVRNNDPPVTVPTAAHKFLISFATSGPGPSRVQMHCSPQLNKYLEEFTPIHIGHIINLHDLIVIIIPK